MKRPWTDFDKVINDAADLEAPPDAMKSLGVEIRDQCADRYPGETITHVVLASETALASTWRRPSRSSGERWSALSPCARRATSWDACFQTTSSARAMALRPDSPYEHGLSRAPAPGITTGFKWPLMKLRWI